MASLNYHEPIISTPISTNIPRIDFLGCLLLILATISFTAAFQEVGWRFSYDSAYFITLITISVLLWTTLLLYERHVTLATQCI